MRHRTSVVLTWFGIVLLVVSPGWPLSVKVLHNTHILEGWEGFGAFALGMELWPWLAASGAVFLLAGLMMGAKTRRPRRRHS